MFSKSKGFSDLPVTVPCGRCRGCRLEYSRQWAIRCVHEASLYDENIFITLTYDNENLPSDYSVNKEHLQKFFKKLRKAGYKFRYYACAEYGDLNNRPHYHAILFGMDFKDKILHTKQNGNLLFKSAELQKIWGKGFCLIGHVTFQSCAYVARYVMKKFKNDKRDPSKLTQYYNRQIDDKKYQLEPEFNLVSKGDGGIGKGWYERFKTDTDKDFITLDGTRMSLPKFYDYLLEKEDPDELQIKKAKRKCMINLDDNTTERLIQKDKVKQAQINLLKRELK